jgi:hypothetical protein
MSRRLLYSVLKRINEKDALSPNAQDYKMKDGEFREYIFFIKEKGYIIGEIMTFDKYSLKFATVTDMGLDFLNQHIHFHTEYPSIQELPNWVRKNIME